MEFRRIDQKNMYVGNRGWYYVMKSYNKIIVIMDRKNIYINKDYYNISPTTSKHRNLFLGVDSKGFERNVKNNKYIFLSDNEIQELFYSIE